MRGTGRIWENQTLDRFLEAMAAWIAGAQGSYTELNARRRSHLRVTASPNHARPGRAQRAWLTATFHIGRRGSLGPRVSQP
ncbi:DUF7660 family protein [Streptomyces niveus]|uniref:DUF7660 family protein n=1 Tax=Streptomyces niveus TaxID=193462 RepID=UPI00406BA7D0